MTLWRCQNCTSRYAVGMYECPYCGWDIYSEDNVAGLVISTVNAERYGAKGDNIADDTAAIQAAIDAVPATGGTVFLKAGTYRISSALNVKSKLEIVGDGPGTVIQQLNTAAHCLAGTALTRFSLRDVWLQGPGSGTGDGVHFLKGANAATFYMSFHDVTIAGFGQDGISIENPIVSTFEVVVSQNNGRYGFNLFGQVAGAAGTSVSMDSCFGNGNTTAGIRLYNLVYSALQGCAGDNNAIGYLIDACQAVTLSGCGAESNTTNGFKVNAGYGTTLNGAWVFDNKSVGVWVTGNAQGVTAIGTIDNTPAVSAVNFIKVDTGCKMALINCNNTSPNSLAATTTTTLV